MISGQTNRLQRWLRLDPETKPKIYSQIYASAELLNLTYWLEILLSAGIATFGLVEDSPAVIIGAMLISPLMDPIMAAGLGMAAGDLYLAVKALLKLLASVAASVALSGLLVWVLPFHSPTAEILARTNPTLLDLGIALLSGLAGSFAVNRAGGGDGVTTLPGVAIAVALMPPLCTIGFGVGAGWNTAIMGGAGLLFLTNIVAIVFAAFFIFLVVGMNSRQLRSVIASTRAGEPMARRLETGPLRWAFVDGGQLRWRVLLLIVLLGAIALPLQRALKQLAGEAVARNAVQQAVKGLVPPRALVSQQTVVGSNSVAVRLVVTQAILPQKLRQAEAEISKRSGRQAEVDVQSVASQSELAELAERIQATSALLVQKPAQPPPAAPETLQAMQQDLIARVQPVLQAAWPAEAPLQDFAVSASPKGLVLQAHYQSAKPLSPVALGLLTEVLQQKLNDPGLTLNAQAIHAPKPAARQQKPGRRR